MTTTYPIDTPVTATESPDLDAAGALDDNDIWLLWQAAAGKIVRTTGAAARTFLLGNLTGISFGAAGAARDLFLYRDAAGTLAMRNGSAAQRVNLYGTYTDASNYERLAFYFVSGVPTIGHEAGGAGVARDLSFLTNGYQQFRIAYVASAVNYLQVSGGAAFSGVLLSAQGSDSNINLLLSPKGTGKLRFGSVSAIGALTVTGYLDILDSGGTARKLAVVS